LVAKASATSSKLAPVSVAPSARPTSGPRFRSLSEFYQWRSTARIGAGVQCIYESLRPVPHVRAATGGHRHGRCFIQGRQRRGGNASLAPDDAGGATTRGDGGFMTVSPSHQVTDAEGAHRDLQDFPFTRWGADLGRVDDDEVAWSRLLRGSCRWLLTSSPLCRACLGRSLARKGPLGRRLARSVLLGLGLLGGGLARWHGLPPCR
jgi:hypothetical protein